MIEKNTYLYLLGIVGIVAIVGIVNLIGLKSPTLEIQSSSIEEMQACNVDNDCIYADNTCCPGTESANIIAINREFKEEYKLMGEICPEEITCPENVIDYVEVQCVNKVCTIIPLIDI